MSDRRTLLIQAGLDILREEGSAGFAQAKVAARAGLRQGHLTYYFPTRADLLEAVARAAIEQQLANLQAVVSAATTVEQVSSVIAEATVRHENSRMMTSLSQAADQEEAVRAVFQELIAGFAMRLRGLLEKLHLDVAHDRIDMLHALWVGLSVIDLATTRKDGKARSTSVVASALRMMAAHLDGSEVAGLPVAIQSRGGAH